MEFIGFFRKRDPTQGSIIKESLIYTSYLWPNTFFWIVIHLLNLYWLSRIGIEAIAAVGLGTAALMLLMTPIMSIRISTYGMIGSFPREDPQGLEKQIKQILSTSWLISFVLAGIGYFLAPFLLQFFQFRGAEPGVIASAILYLRIQAVIGILSFSFWPINQIIRNLGKMGHGMILMAVVLICQGLFDYFFISQWGVAGASLSRGISGIIGAGLGLWWLGKITNLNFRKWHDFKINLNVFKEIFRIAGFDTIQGFSRQSLQLIMWFIIAPFGTLAWGAYEVGYRFFRYCSMFVMDLSQTTALGCARNLGAQKEERAKRWSWANTGIAALIMGFGGFLFFVFAPELIKFFNQNLEVIEMGTSYFRITTLAGLGYVFFAGSLTLQRAFGAAKNTFTPMWTYLAMMVLQVGLAIILSEWLGINGVWWAILAGMIFYGSVLAVLFKIGSWKPKKSSI